MKIYGPVPSWRLGNSLGVDLVEAPKNYSKICSYNCIYCQLGYNGFKVNRPRKFGINEKDFILLRKKIKETRPDYVTFSGEGEPTINLDLGYVATRIKQMTDIPIAVLTNSSLMHDPQVRKELGLADLVVAKLDAPNEEIFKLVNRPTSGIYLRVIIEGIKKFNNEYPGKLALQIMFVPQNKDYAADLAALAKEIKPVEVEVNTPLRPCPVKPLPPKELAEIKKLFEPLKVYSVYDVERPETKPMDERETRKRRPERR